MLPQIPQAKCPRGPCGQGKRSHLTLSLTKPPRGKVASDGQQSQGSSSRVPAPKASSWLGTCHRAGAACPGWGRGTAQWCYRDTLRSPGRQPWGHTTVARKASNEDWGCGDGGQRQYDQSWVLPHICLPPALAAPSARVTDSTLVS